MRLFRLFDLLDRLRTRSTPVSAETLAQEMEVSLRTVYRDLADLQTQGAPIRGEGGVGYVMDHGYFMPSLHLSQDELEALAFGARLTAARGGPALAKAAATAIAKLASAVGSDDRSALLEAPIAVGPSAVAPEASFDRLRQAVRNRMTLRIHYLDLSGRESERLARPLALTMFDSVWLLTIWCERSDAFRHLRLDRIQQVEETGLRFRHERGKRYDDCLKIERRPPSSLIRTDGRRGERQVGEG
jgi:predicted DNA-binding transcriptional regulator YafY